MIFCISSNVSSQTLLIFWQFILKGIEELSVVANQILSLEMLIIRLLHLKDMPSYESVLDLINKNNLDKDDKILVDQKKTNLNESNDLSKITKNQIKNTIQTKIKLESLSKIIPKDPQAEIISSFEDLIKLSSKKKEVELKYDLEKNVNLVKFTDGKIDISFNENLGKNFVRNLSEKLLEWTKKRWVITLTKEAGEKTFSQLKSIKKKELINEQKNSKLYKKFKNLFPDVELIDVLKKD